MVVTVEEYIRYCDSVNGSHACMIDPEGNDFSDFGKFEDMVGIGDKYLSQFPSFEDYLKSLPRSFVNDIKYYSEIEYAHEYFTILKTCEF